MIFIKKYMNNIVRKNFIINKIFQICFISYYMIYIIFQNKIKIYSSRKYFKKDYINHNNKNNKYIENIKKKQIILQYIIYYNYIKIMIYNKVLLIYLSNKIY